MESLYLLIPLSLVLAFVIGGIFWWATRNGQFDDMEGPAHRILMDDDKPKDGGDDNAPRGD
ncbi:cbb3-type cytochrome oxidase maturation protein [Chromobacterium alkanivorans]|uniref:cbb3-type cytochrome oxidase assembly protein CcoS n=1 Tax=Chromobacterium TaxID=535 RepID=UPI000653C5CC|nr:MULTISPECIES: cbb3-type cytochrome oxidase assembly protein CcoS [Chromobacterium]KMN83754.1 cytochrome oxidase maturation protein Cbb3 [Chromobacterium sp. LK11]MBN3006341.1 cbb3-type cytochrome oxidase assembly protein CcoS [Chromobacterium alkanivorans]MCS3804044.1 cbb3-type cytochrome oxidase maturation protein [Chromobacterium alkanivorans]MCS3818735.1 cbb3-type cytochrome oxidase maturation protein [Chromobacterium alkanivorans]MCS3876119.1 cbb3-type cytochrome oxidase maturation prot